MVAMAKPVPNGSSPAYQNPFDLASGGASLTRATQDGIPFSNPSLLALGPGFLRWIWLRAGPHAGFSPLSTGRDVMREKTVTPEQLQELKSGYLHLGFDANAGFLSRNGGITFFSTNRGDIEGVETSPAEGNNALEMTAYSYTGSVITGAFSLNDSFAVGVSMKSVYAGEFEKRFSPLEIQDTTALREDIQESLVKGTGIGSDIGFTYQNRTKNKDLRIALVSTNAIETKFSGGVPTWKRAFHLGIGGTFHTRDNGIHCSLDVRDVGDVYGEDFNDRLYTGCKFLFENRVGLGMGLAKLKGTAGIILNLTLIRLEAGSYVRDIQSEFGTKLRRVYFVAIGLEIP